MTPMEIFCNSVKMNNNFYKTKIIVFRNGEILKRNEAWTFQGQEIEVVPFYKYLGFFMTPKHVWTKSVEMLSRQALKCSASTFRYQIEFGHFLPKDIFKLFDSKVKPFLFYGAEIWGCEYQSKIEQVHLKVCRRYCNLSSKANATFSLRECGRSLLCISHMTKSIRYWLRLLYMDRSRCPKQCYEMLKNLDAVGWENWASHIRALLFRYRFGYVWIAQDVRNRHYFIKVFS